jgi:hypothetical protein
MANYKLDVAFTKAQLETLYITGSNVVIAKPSGGGSPNVAWQVFKPMQANTLNWGEEYGIYASTAAVVNGATLSQLSNVPVGAAMNKLYTLEPNSIITGPASGGQPHAYSLENRFDPKPYMTVGLFQDATVNGTDIIGNAVSAAPVMLASTANMTPYTTVYIWIQSQVVSNSVVTSVTSPMTELRFGGGTNEMKIAYDSQSGKFLSVSSNKAIESLIRHIPASL